MGWEVTTSNIGLAGLGIDGNSLPLYTGPTAPPAGTLIENRLITVGLALYNGDIIVRKCLFRPTSVSAGAAMIVTYNNSPPYQTTPTTVTIEDCEFDGTLLSDYDAAWAVGFKGIANMYRNYIHHFGGGIGFTSTGMQLDAIVENNYVTDLVSYGDSATTGNHCDGFTIREFNASQNPARTAMIRNNRFDCHTTNASGACFLQANIDNIDNVTIQGNLLEGNGYNLVLEEKYNTYNNMSCINNRFNVQGFGAHYYTGPDWVQWRENYRNNSANPDNRGVVVPM